MEPILNLFLLIFPFLYGIKGLLFDGPCPKINGIPDFHCPDHLKGTNYAIMAHLPVDNTTLNIFYNAYESLDCLTYTLSCSYTSTSVVSAKTQCAAINRKWWGFQDASILSCLPNLINFDENLTWQNPVQAFGLSLQVQCPEKLADFRLKIMTSEKFVIIYGCRQIGFGEQHEEGMWLLVNSSEIHNFDIFDEAMGMIEGTSARKEDFVRASGDGNSTCNCIACEYMYKCPTTVVEETNEIADDEDDYYQFTKPSPKKKEVEEYYDYYKNYYDDYHYGEDYYNNYEYPDYYYHDVANGTENFTESGWVEATTEGTEMTEVTEMMDIKQNLTEEVFEEVLEDKNDTFWN